MLNEASLFNSESTRISNFFCFLYALVFTLLLFHILSLFDLDSDLSNSRQ